VGQGCGGMVTMPLHMASGMADVTPQRGVCDV
jgi:hypothetical protein